MEETLIEIKCDSFLQDGSYCLQLVRRLQDESDSFVLLFESVDGYMQSERSREVVIPAKTVEQWFAQLSQSTVPIIIDGIQGCDGVTYQLNFYNGLFSSCYQWWLDAPEAYRPLVEFANQLLKAVGHEDRLEIRDSV